MASLFAKRARPVSRARLRTEASGSEANSEASREARSTGARPVRLSLEDEGEGFRVKKSRLSRKLARTRGRGLQVAGSAEPEVVDVEPHPEPQATDPDPSEALGEAPGTDSEGQDASAAGRAARLARARRAAARELGEAEGPREALVVPVREASLALGSLAHADAEGEAADAWALQQMRTGAHRRYGDLASVGLEASGFSQGPLPATERQDVPLRKAKSVSEGLGLRQKMAEDFALVSRARVPTAAEAMGTLWEVVRCIEQGEQERSTRRKELEEQRKDTSKQLDAFSRELPSLERSLKVSQELDEFVWSLAGLLDAKASKLKQASDTLAQMERDFSARRLLRRHHNLVASLNAAGATLSAGEADADGGEDTNEQLPRGGRRRLGDAGEGWDTSDDSEDGLADLAADRAAFCTAAHKQLAADVSERFTATSSLVAPAKAAKLALAQGDYAKAYVPLSLPEALSLHVEHSLLWWDPLRLCLPRGAEGGTRWGPRRPVSEAQLESFEWFDELLGFTELQGEADPDSELLPQLIRRCVFPQVARRLRDCWDISSSQQSARCAALLDECLLFESEGTGAFAGLLDAACERIEVGLTQLAPEVFVPGEEVSRWYGSEARFRLLWRCCKIARCVLALEGRVPDARLGPLVLQSIFQTRIAPHLRCPRRCAREMDLLERFVDALPERWLASGLPSQLAPLRDALGPRAPPSEATAEQAARILRRMRCLDEAQVLQRP